MLADLITMPPFPLDTGNPFRCSMVVLRLRPHLSRRPRPLYQRWLDLPPVPLARVYRLLAYVKGVLKQLGRQTPDRL
jgi:hypothetical protein